MAWSKIKKAPLTKSLRRETPHGLWQKCTSCQNIIYQRDFFANQFVCVKCLHHYAIPPLERLRHFLDPETFQECDAQLASSDPLNFCDTKSYEVRLGEARRKASANDAIVCGAGSLLARPVLVGVYDFRFMGGSMGSVVGEKIARLFKRGAQQKLPVIVFSASGGARMQEGILSLMQMAKTCAALSMLRDEGIPLISVMTNPTTGGVAASYAMLGDINIAEPGALIGFAGPRVIQQTIGESLPAGFQRSEYLLKHGMLDLICARAALRERIGQILRMIPSKSAAVG